MKHFTSFLFALVAMFCVATSASAALDTSKTYYMKSLVVGVYANVPSSTGSSAYVATSKTTKSELIFTEVDGGYTIKDANNGNYIGIDSWNCVSSSTPFVWEVTETEGGYYIKNTEGTYKNLWMGAQFDQDGVTPKGKFYNNNPAQVLIVLEPVGAEPGPGPEPEPEVKSYDNVALHNLAGDYLCIGSVDMNVSSTEFKWDLNGVRGLDGAYMIKQHDADWWVNSGSYGRLSKANSTGNARHFYFYEVTANDGVTVEASLVAEPEVGKNYLVGVSNITSSYHGFYVVYGQLASGSTNRLDVIKINGSAVNGSTIAVIPTNLEIDINANVDSNNNAITSFDKVIWTLEGEAPVNNNPNVTYIYTFNGKELYRETVTETLGAAPTKAVLPAYVTATGYPETIVAGTTSYTIETTIPDLPFEFGKYYYIDEWAVSSRHYFLYANEQSDKLRETKQNVTTADVNTLDAARLSEYLWTVDGDWYNGFTFCNRLGYYMQAPNANPANGTEVQVTDTEDALCRFDLFKQAPSGKYSYRPHGGSNYIAHTSDGNLIPGFYNAYADASLEATTFTYIEYVPNWAAFETLLTKLENTNFGDDFGQYGVKEGAAMTGGYPLSVEVIEDYLLFARVDYEARDVDYYESDMAAMTYFSENILLNMPKAGDFFRAKGNSGNYLTLPVAGTFGKMAAEGDILCYTTEGNLVSYTTGLGVYNTHTVAPVGSTLNVITFKIGEGEGKYQIQTNTTGGGTYFYDHTGYKDGDILNRNSAAAGYPQCQWMLETVKTLPVSVSAAGYATLYAPAALKVPAGVEAYTLTVAGEHLLHANAVEGTIPAGTAVVLKAEAGNYDFAITTGGTTTDNVLVGNAAAIVKPAGALVLGMEEGEVGFYGYNGANLAGFKAYYVPAANESNFRISFGELTGIFSAAKENGGQAIFDLQGRRVVSDKGLTIQNGKKVIR